MPRAQEIVCYRLVGGGYVHPQCFDDAGEVDEKIAARTIDATFRLWPRRAVGGHVVCIACGGKTRQPRSRLLARYVSCGCSAKTRRAKR